MSASKATQPGLNQQNVGGDEVPRHLEGPRPRLQRPGV